MITKAHWLVIYESGGYECRLCIEGNNVTEVLAEGKRLLAELTHQIRAMRRS